MSFGMSGEQTGDWEWSGYEMLRGGAETDAAPLCSQTVLDRK